MNLEKINIAMKRLASHFGRIAKGLCTQEQTDFVLCDAQERVVFSTIPSAENDATLLSGQCASCKAVFEQIKKSDPRKHEYHAVWCENGHRVHSAPLRGAELTLGILYARESNPTDSNSNNTSEAIQSMAHLLQEKVFLEIESDSLTEDLSVRYEELSVLYDLGEKLSVQSRRSAVIEYVLTTAADAVVSACAVWVPEDNDSLTVFLKDADSPDAHDLMTAAEQISLAAPSSSRHHPEPIVQNYLEDDLAITNGKRPFRHAMLVPVRAGEQQFGTLVLLRTRGEEFLSGDTKVISSLAHRSAITIHNTELYRDLRDLFLNTMKTLVFVIEGKDPYTRGHSERVNALATRLGEALGIPEEDKQTLNWASLLHDIGKLKIPETILQKPGRLTPRELTTVQCHPAYGAELLAPIQQLAPCLATIRHHHERIDGNGYPGNLKGEEIPILARIIAVADTWDALTSDRCYRPRFNADQAVEIMKEVSGTQLDSKIVETLLSRRDEMVPSEQDYKQRVLVPAGAVAF